MALAGGVGSRLERRFVFCYLSGMGADRTESARLPWERQTRHLKGRTERGLLGVQSAHPSFVAYNFRPAGIVKNEQTAVRRWLAPIAVTSGELARAMIRVGIGEVTPQRDCVTNREIQRIAAM